MAMKRMRMTSMDDSRSNVNHWQKDTEVTSWLLAIFGEIKFQFLFQISHFFQFRMIDRVVLHYFVVV